MRGVPLLSRTGLSLPRILFDHSFVIAIRDRTTASAFAPSRILSETSGVVSAQAHNVGNICAPFLVCARPHNWRYKQCVTTTAMTLFLLPVRKSN